LDSPNLFGRERLVLDQELPVFLGEYVVGDRGQSEAIAQGLTEGKHKSGFPTANRSANPDSESSFSIVPLDGLLPLVKAAGARKLGMRMRMMRIVMASAHV
jgi:hypothetical protein